jgi:hypothetical protein
MSLTVSFEGVRIKVFFVTYNTIIQITSVDPLVTVKVTHVSIPLVTLVTSKHLHARVAKMNVIAKILVTHSLEATFRTLKNPI